MKTVCALLVILAVLCSSCQRSQFTTSARTDKKGRVTYTKSYHYESRKLTKGKSHKNRIKSAEMQSAPGPDNKRIFTPELTRIKPVKVIHSENLIASTNMAKVLTALSRANERSAASPQMISSGISHPDTIIKDKQVQAGQKEAQSPDSRKVEKLGLAGFILSIPGLVPIFGLPLAILGVIFGSISLRKIKRNPTLYKGKGFAIASIILGVLGILGILLFIG